jgi:hypothetical protein
MGLDLCPPGTAVKGLDFGHPGMTERARLVSSKLNREELGLCPSGTKEKG